MHTLPLPGDLVWIRQRRWRVERVRRDRSVVRLDVAQPRRTADLPGAVRSARRRQAIRSAEARAATTGAGASRASDRARLRRSDARVAPSMRTIDLLPHQLEPALAFLHGARRVLDRRRRRSGQDDSGRARRRRIVRRDPSARVLVVVPVALRDQWTAELQHAFRHRRRGRPMRARLGESGTVGGMRRQPVGACRGSGSPRSTSSNSRTCSTRLPLHPWDLVVVDEAHGACGDSERHQACHEISADRAGASCSPPRRIRATTRGSRGWSTLGALGERRALTIFRRTRQDVGVQASRRCAGRACTLSAAERRVLADARAFESAVLRRCRTRRPRSRAAAAFGASQARAVDDGARSADRSIVGWRGWRDATGRIRTGSSRRSDSTTSSDDVERRRTRRARPPHSGMRAAHERSWLRRLRDARRAARCASKAKSRTSTPLLAPDARAGRRLHGVPSLARAARAPPVGRVRPLAVLHGGQTDHRAATAASIGF